MFGLTTLRRRWLRGHPHMSVDGWLRWCEGIPLLQHLDSTTRLRLLHLVTVFLDEKDIQGAQGVDIDEGVRRLIAVQACIPVLELGIGYYDGWSSVVVYPGAFRADTQITDASGVTHTGRRQMSGEAWSRGPVILSWQNVLDDAHVIDDSNVVIHEFAHKLDMLNGAANGFPPLHRDMDREQWSATFSHAFEDLSQRVSHGEATVIDPYATTNPAEFFAVVSEVFFMEPESLNREYPQVYAQLAGFYRQDPLQRIPSQA